MCPDPGRWLTEDRVADLELRHRRTDRLDVTGELDPEALPSRPAGPGDHPPQDRIGAADVGVGLRHRARPDADEDLVVLRDRSLDLLDPEHVGRPVTVLNDGLHGFILVAC